MKKKRKSGETYDINKQTIYIASKSKIKSKAHHATEPAQGTCINLMFSMAANPPYLPANRKRTPFFPVCPWCTWPFFFFLDIFLQCSETEAQASVTPQKLSWNCVQTFDCREMSAGLALRYLIYKWTHTHTRLTAPCPGLPRWAGTRKVPIWILLKQETTSGSGISWAICKSASRSRQITTPAPHHSVFKAGCPSCRPTNSVKKLKATSTNGQRTENATTWNYHSTPDRGTEYRDVCVCLRAYLWNFLHIRSSPNFLCILPVAVARSSSDSVAICYVFPALYMTSCLTECSACAALSLAMKGAQ